MNHVLHKKVLKSFNFLTKIWKVHLLVYWAIKWVTPKSLLYYYILHYEFGVRIFINMVQGYGESILKDFLNDGGILFY
jgi:hypothetical protein